MNTRRFLNPSQPQTLYMAVILCYIDAFFNLFGGVAIIVLIGLALAAGGYAIANEKKWGYTLAVVAAVAQVLFILAVWGATTFTALAPLLAFIFDGALVVLLVHPMSRDYQRIWFR